MIFISVQPLSRSRARLSYSIRFSSRGYDSTRKVDRFALSFSNFSFSTVTSEYSKIRVIRDNDSASTLPFDSSLFNMDFDLPRSQDSRFQIWIFETIIQTESSPLTLIFRYSSAAPWPSSLNSGNNIPK